MTVTRRLTSVAVALLLAGAVAVGAGSKPVTFYAEWSYAPDGHSAAYCHDYRHSPWENCYVFPGGGTIRAIKWNTAVKAREHEALFCLYLSPNGTVTSPAVRVSCQHHVSRQGSTMHAYSQDRVDVVIPPSWALFLFVDGYGSASEWGYPLESQITVYVE